VSKFFFRFAIVSEVRSSYVDVACIIEIADFYKMQTIRLNTRCQLISLFAMKETNKANSALCSIFQSSLQSTSFGVLFCSCGGDPSAL
jgi:hypothetical protein